MTLTKSILQRNEKTRYAKRHNGFSRAGGKPLKNLERLLESLTRGEANALGSLDLDSLAGLRVDSLAGLTIDNLESTEADQLKALVLLDEGLDAFDNGSDDFFGVGLGGVFAECLLDGFNEVYFAAHGLLGWVIWLVMSCDTTDPKKTSSCCQLPL